MFVSKGTGAMAAGSSRQKRREFSYRLLSAEELTERRRRRRDQKEQQQLPGGTLFSLEFVLAASLFVWRWCQRTATGALVAAIVVVVLVSGHNFNAMLDPVTPVTFLDRVSLWLGVHTQSAVVVIDFAPLASLVHTFVFQRRVSDGSFLIASQVSHRLLPGVLEPHTDDTFSYFTHVRGRVEEVASVAEGQVVKALGSRHLNPSPTLVKISNGNSVRPRLQRHLFEEIRRRFSNSSILQFDPERSLGTLTAREERTLQWFAINLLSHRLGPQLNQGNTALIMDLGESDLEVTLALPTGGKQPPEAFVKETSELTAFGRFIRLTTLSFKSLGLLAARNEMLRQSNVMWKVNDAAVEKNESDFLTINSGCLNPVTEAFWEYDGKRYHVLGKSHPDSELVRERNGPFAGKKIHRPVADLSGCRKLAQAYVKARNGLSPSDDEDKPKENSSEEDLLAFFREGRDVFVEGQLLEKCLERGLTLPVSGGNVRMKSLADSMLNACKVPNTEQPFACADLTYLMTLLEVMAHMEMDGVIRSARRMDLGLQGEWPLAAAMHVYENGL